MWMNLKKGLINNNINKHKMKMVIFRERFLLPPPLPFPVVRIKEGELSLLLDGSSVAKLHGRHRTLFLFVICYYNETERK